MHLEDYGFTARDKKAFRRFDDEGFQPARVVRLSCDSTRLVAESGEFSASIAGRLRHEARSPSKLPAVGDWVSFRQNRIEAVLPRKTELSRKVAGKRTEEQVVAANVDKVVIVMGLDSDFNARRLERYLTTVWESGASPVVLLNKADLTELLEARREETEAVAMGCPVLVSSCLDGSGLDAVRETLRPRETAVLVGSSGVGKSTRVNRLLGGEVQKTRAVRDKDDRGQHTTTSRELASERLESFRALQKELRYLRQRQEESAQGVEKEKWRAIHREMRKSGRHRRT